MAPFIGTKDISTKRYESSVMKPLIDAGDMFEQAATQTTHEEPLLTSKTMHPMIKPRSSQTRILRE
jgi:hypothetical protein